jgi:hypothetical protein
MTTETEPRGTDDTAVLQATPEKASIWEDFIDIFFAPSEVFARRRDGRFWIALLVMTVLVGVLFYASQGPLAGVFDGEFRRGMARAGEAGNRMSEEQMAQARAISERFAVVGVVIAILVGTLLIGLVIWAVSRPFGAVAGLAVAMAIATYSQFPKILQSALNILQGIFFEPDSLSAISFGPARFFDADTASPVLLALLGRLDLFILWPTVLIAIGLAVAARMDRSSAALVAAIVWLLGAVPTVLPVLMQG